MNPANPLAAKYRCICLKLFSPLDLRMEDAQVSEPVGQEVTVDVAYGGICGSDLHYFNHGGMGAIRLQEPMILGHEVAGTVSSVGPDVKNLKVGDRVAVTPSRPCWNCRYCALGQPNQCVNMRYYGSAMRMPHLQGAFQSRLVCEAKQCFKVAPGVSMRLAALAEPFAVALHAANQAGSLLGKHVLVTGCGPIGALCVAAARIHGAASITVTDILDEPLAIAKKLGASSTINVLADKDWAQKYSADKGSFDALFECSGNPLAIKDGLAVLRPRSPMVQLGLGGDVTIPMNLITTKEILFTGSFRFHNEFETAVSLINEGRLDLSPLITQTYKADKAVDAFTMASNRKEAMKVLIDFQEMSA